MTSIVFSIIFGSVPAQSYNYVELSDHLWAMIRDYRPRYFWQDQWKMILLVADELCRGFTAHRTCRWNRNSRDVAKDDGSPVGRNRKERTGRNLTRRYRRNGHGAHRGWWLRGRESWLGL